MKKSVWDWQTERIKREVDSFSLRLTLRHQRLSFIRQGNWMCLNMLLLSFVVHMLLPLYLWCVYLSINIAPFWKLLHVLTPLQTLDIWVESPYNWKFVIQYWFNTVLSSVAGTVILITTVDDAVSLPLH